MKIKSIILNSTSSVLFTLLLIHCSLFTAFAQQTDIDSLKQALKNYDARKMELKQPMYSAADTTKVKTLNILSWNLVKRGDYKEAIQYADDALALSQNITYLKGEANARNNIGIIYWYQGNYPDALKEHFAALRIREEIGDKKGISKSHMNIGIIYTDKGNYPDALKEHFAALRIQEEIGDKKGIANSHNNIENIYYRQGNYPDALKEHFAALKIREEIGDKQGIANSHNNIGPIYSDKGNYPDALKEYFAALKIFEEIGDKKGIAASHMNIGNIYKYKGNYSDALKEYFASLKIKEEIGNKQGIAGTDINIGATYLKQNKPKEALEYANKGLSLALEIEALDVVQDAYGNLASIDSARGDFKSAFANHKQYIFYRDSLLNEENTKKTVQQKMQYEFDKKETETKAEQDKKDVLTQAEINKQKLIRNGFVAGFVVVLLFAFVFFRQRNKTKKEKLRAEEEKKKSEDLLLNILPAEVASELKASGSTKAKAFTMVTVMFTDFKDFTTVSEKISAELLVDEIHHCFSGFDNILHKYKIEKIKTIGDAYLCASGLPVSNYTHAVDMVNCAFEIRNFMLERKKEKESRGEIPFELRIGIHTGPVVAGIVGVKKFAYDIWGDTVNLAARMEQNSEAGKVNISGNTYELVKDKFNCTHRGKIQAKNKGEIDMYFVEAIA